MGGGANLTKAQQLEIENNRRKEQGLPPKINTKVNATSPTKISEGRRTIERSATSVSAGRRKPQFIPLGPEFTRKGRVRRPTLLGR